MFDTGVLLYYTHKSTSTVRLVTGWRLQTAIDDIEEFGIQKVERYIPLSSKVLGVWNDDC